MTNTTATATAPLTLDITIGEYFPPEQRSKEDTARVLSTSTMVFLDAEDAIAYLVDYKGLSAERAARVIARRCEFQIEDLDHPLRFKVYRFRRAS